MQNNTAVESWNIATLEGWDPEPPAFNIPANIKKLLIVSHVIHYRYKGRLYAYGPYVREIDMWAQLFPQVIIAAPRRQTMPPSDAQVFTGHNITIVPQPETGGHTIQAKLSQAARLPMMLWSLVAAMMDADAIQVRCPGNLGLLGVLMAPLFSRYLVAKYAGQWNGYEGERATVRMQRSVLKSSWWKGPVTVYGQWPDQPPHVIPFFTSMMTAEQVERAITVAEGKEITSPLRVLFSGRLVKEKRVSALLNAIKVAKDNGVQLEVAILGQGPEENSLRAQANELGILEQVQFIGGLPFEEALEWYDWAHCLVLPSVHSEGWPKVIAEAMCSGIICIAVRHGQVPSMLEGRGLLLEEGTPDEIADALQGVARNPQGFKPMMQEASEWARKYSLDGLREANAELLSRYWGEVQTQSQNRSRKRLWAKLWGQRS